MFFFNIYAENFIKRTQAHIHVYVKGRIFVASLFLIGKKLVFWFDGRSVSVLHMFDHVQLVRYALSFRFLTVHVYFHSVFLRF